MKKITPVLLIIPFVFLVASTSVLATNEIIVDNSSADFSKTGTWSTSTYVPGYYGNNYAYATGGSGEMTATWHFQIPSAGVYKVFAWWPGTYDTRSPDAPYSIYHMGGSTTVRADQRINGAQWNDLGMYQFAAGQNRVMLTNAATNNPVADAVRIVYLGDLDYVVAQFTAAPIIGINPLSVSFTDTSLGAIQTWQWDFGDGESSTEQNPTHVYQNPGTYTVTLTVTGGGQQSTKTRTDYILVNPDDGTYATSFRWPIDEQDFFIMQAFGNVRTNASGKHTATDFGVYQFDVPAHCIANGWVEKINPDSYSNGMGNGIMIKHKLPDGTFVYSWYNHFANPVSGFTLGQFIAQGTILGTVGQTGWSPSGVHVHLEIKKTNTFDSGYQSDLSDFYNPYAFIYARLSGVPSGVQHCSDGTPINACSETKPLHCIEGGYLVSNSILCGCETGVAQADSTCTKTEAGIIIDNDDPEFSYSGPWEHSNEVMGFYGRDYLIVQPWYGAATATWTPTIIAPGNYQVYGWWRDHLSASGSSNATNAPLTINHAGQQDVVQVDFSDYHKGWKYLGTFEFEAGAGNSVVLSNTPNPGGDVIADAFRFVIITTSTTSSAEPTTTTTIPDTTSTTSTIEPTTTTSILPTTTTTSIQPTTTTSILPTTTTSSVEPTTTTSILPTTTTTSISSTTAPITTTIPPNSIYGRVTGAIQADVTINLYQVSCSSNSLVANTRTDVEGNYLFSDLSGFYTIEAVATGYSFTPPSYVNVNPENNISHDFIATIQITTTSSSVAPTTSTALPTTSTTIPDTTSSTSTSSPSPSTIPPNSIYGRVTGAIQADVTINLYQVSCSSNSLVANTRTDVEGNYLFSDLSGFYTIEAVATGYSFTPPSYVNVNPENNISHDFISN